MKSWFLFLFASFLVTSVYARDAVVLYNDAPIFSEAYSKKKPGARLNTGDHLIVDSVASQQLRSDGRKELWYEVSSGTVRGWMEGKNLFVIDVDGVYDAFQSSATSMKVLLEEAEGIGDPDTIAVIDSPGFYVSEILNKSATARLHAARRYPYFLKDSAEIARLWKRTQADSDPQVRMAGNLSLAQAWETEPKGAVAAVVSSDDFRRSLAAGIASQTGEELETYVTILLTVPPNKETPTLLDQAARKGSPAALRFVVNAWTPAKGQIVFPQLAKLDPELRSELIKKLPLSDPAVVDFLYSVVKDKREKRNFRIIAAKNLLRYDPPKSKQDEMAKTLMAFYKSLPTDVRADFAHTAASDISHPLAQEIGSQVLTGADPVTYAAYTTELERVIRCKESITPLDWLPKIIPTIKDIQRRKALRNFLVPMDNDDCRAVALAAGIPAI